MACAKIDDLQTICFLVICNDNVPVACPDLILCITFCVTNFLLYLCNFRLIKFAS